MATTIKDIAEATGVSAMTVSRFFNEPEKLKKKTYEKIKSAVDKMGYEPNHIARLLATNKTNIVCVYIANDIDALHPFTLQSVAGIGERLGEKGYSMLLVRDTYKKKCCDGIIAMGLSGQEEDELMELSERKPVIIFGNSSYKKNWVDINNYKGSYEATEYLIKRGYKKIGNIGITNAQRYPKDRLQGYLDCMDDYNMEIVENSTTRVNNHEDDGYLAAKRIYETTDVDALVCASDVLALGAMRCANEKGIEVPNELGIVGFDGLGYEKLVTPYITTVQQPVYCAGKKLADSMVQVLETGIYSGTEVLLDTVLMINGSTK